MKTRLIDIAEAAHVSEATVSRVLAGKAGVNPDTRDKVMAIAHRLGRHSDAQARFSQPMIGISIPNVENPVFPLFLERLEAEAFASGLDTLVSVNARSDAQEAASLERLVHAGAGGLIVISGQHAHDETGIDHYAALASRGIKLCLINGVRDGVEANFISTDDAAAVRLSLNHLRHLGHSRMGLAVGDEHSWPVRQKVSEFEKLHAGARPPIAFTDFSFAGGYQAAIELHAQGCTAIICGSDQMAMGAISALRDVGLQVPRDVSIVGYDDIPSARMHAPSITTVRQPLQVMTRAAVRSVMGTNGESRQASRSVFTVGPELVVRGSTAPPPEALRLTA